VYVLVVDALEGEHSLLLPQYRKMTEKLLRKLDFFVWTELSMLQE
jgi:hypothetical protein